MSCHQAVDDLLRTESRAVLLQLRCRTVSSPFMLLGYHANRSSLPTFKQQQIGCRQVEIRAALADFLPAEAPIPVTR